MIEIGTNLDWRQTTAGRVEEIFNEHQRLVHRRTDRMFAGLMTLQWLAGVAAALLVSPKSWEGAASQTHPHVWAALFLGGAISALPIVLALTHPGHVTTRYTVAVGQMLMGALLIHLTGGRIETHFHVFGSLAFLSFYRDWRVLVPATVVVAADHFLRGVFWPQSVYGVLTVSSWRWFEHAGWVTFENIFLVISCIRSKREMWEIAEQTAELSFANISLEQRIREREKAEETLRGQQEFLRKVADANPNLIFVKDWNGRFTFVNKALADIYGATVESIVGKCDADFNSNQEEVEQFLRDDREVMESLQKKFIPEEQLTNTSTGEVHWFQAIKVPLASPQSDVESRQILGVSSDITERKRAESERALLMACIQEQRKQLSNIITNVPGIVWETLSQPGMQPYDYVSDYAEGMLGYRVEEWLSIPDFWLQIVHPEDNERAAAERAAIFAGREGGTSQFRWLTKDGRVVWVEAHIAVECDGAGNPVGMRGVTMDITERKEAELKQARLEQKLRQAQKMESIGTLAGGIAHDFNNILGAIVGYSELAADELPSQHSAQAHLVQVLKASNRAKELVQQVLTFSRQQGPDRKPIRLEQAVDEALNLLRASLPSTIEIHRHIEQETPTILGDLTRIHQVMMNLGTNAMHAIGDRGGVFEVKLAALDVDSEFAKMHHHLYEGKYLRLTVSDTGCGMDQHTQERIFDPFFTTKEPGKGTGLGLSTVYAIVKDHDGAISVYSEPGEGTTFNIYFPVHLGTTIASVTEPFEVGKGRGQCILFVDDEEPLALLGKQRLERLGYDVKAHTSSVEALEAFEASPDQFDLVITDYTMPRMNGDDLARHVLNVRPDLPVVLVTGYSSTINAERATSIGIREMLMKPTTAQIIGEVVNRVLTKKREE
jgi:PAS domain S-box-containing protein